MRIFNTSFAKMMRAIRVHKFGDPQVLQLETNLPIPDIQDNQVLIRMFATGINPVDTYIRSGSYDRKPQLPYIPGSDGAGVVADLGKNVSKFKKGQRVFTAFRTITGTYAEYCVCDENALFPLCERLNFNQGAAVGVPYFTAYRALIHKAKAHASQTILIHGASGAVGIALVQMARAYGLNVIGTAGSSEGLKLIQKNGVHHAFNHKEPGYTGKIMDVTSGNGVDIIMEMLANVNLAKDLNLLAAQGQILIIGSRGEIEINPRLLMHKESSITGVMLAAADEKEWKEMGNAVISGLELGWIKPEIDREYLLEEAIEAHKDVINHSAGSRGKLVLAISSYC